MTTEAQTQIFMNYIRRTEQCATILRSIIASISPQLISIKHELEAYRRCANDVLHVEMTQMQIDAVTAEIMILLNVVSPIIESLPQPTMTMIPPGAKLMTRTERVEEGPYPAGDPL